MRFFFLSVYINKAVYFNHFFNLISRPWIIKRGGCYDCRIEVNYEVVIPKWYYFIII